MSDGLWTAQPVFGFPSNDFSIFSPPCSKLAIAEPILTGENSDSFERLASTEKPVSTKFPLLLRAKPPFVNSACGTASRRMPVIPDEPALNSIS